MCGISGALAYKSDHLGRVGARMINALKHRGPDGHGTWVDEHQDVLLVHTRLSILDLSAAGAQPMESACGRFVITFNGEIYNHLRLRVRLEEERGGMVWRGHSDTETLLACISIWGISKTLKSVFGMFAFALWDKADKKLTLARDRAGEKPLYWARAESGILFSSELQAFDKLPGFNRRIDNRALGLLMRHGYIPAPYAIYSDCKKLIPGSYVSFSLDDKRLEPEEHSYWSWENRSSYDFDFNFTSKTNVTSGLDGILQGVVADQMISDVPFGSFLSGGIDSSLITAVMQKQSSVPIKTFSIGFDDPEFNEAEHAKAVARHLGTEHSEAYVTGNDVISLIPRLPEIYSEPFADSSQLPTYLLAKMARADVKVALSGDGADELFGGYTPYQFIPRIWRMIRWCPPHIRYYLLRALYQVSHSQKIDKLSSIAHHKSPELFYKAAASHWLEPSSIVKGLKGDPITAFDLKSFTGEIHALPSWMMLVDSMMYMPDDVLAKVDRASMANSLEVRAPFLDPRVIEFAKRLPAECKIRSGTSKWILRNLLYNYIPRHLVDRPKKGFSVPLAEWLRTDLREWADDLLSPHKLNDHFHSEPIRRVWAEHLSRKHDHAKKIWNVLMFQAWMYR
jgi:asparagine synthase (glutamine-hydrolysing)|tara:strand:+ start:1984 stop:3852 length:1869 start_codon:yes stop_codon:yes gene_type:complete